MFRIGSLPENEICALTGAKAVPVLDALKRGLKSARLVQKSLIDFEELATLNSALAYKLSFLHNKECASFIQLSECGQFIKVHVEAYGRYAYSGVGYEFRFYPTSLLHDVTLDEIEVFGETQLFVLAYILLKLSSEYEFVILRDKKELKTDNPVVAVYEACIDESMSSTVLTYSEPNICENTSVKISISKDTGLAQVTGCGVSSMDISIVEIFGKMMNTPLEVEFA